MTKKPLLLLIGSKTFFLVLLALFFPLGLAPDEAQYWTWSQALDYGYYSKPFGISAQIAFTTFFLGDNELGVRIGSMIWGALITYLLHSLALKVNFSKTQALWVAFLFALSPVGFYLSFAATTDGPFIFWMLVALFCLLKTMEKKNSNPYFLGLAIAIGLCFKWSAFLFWPIFSISALFAKELREKKMLLAFFISLIGFLPSLIWNYSHEFATFLHVKGNIISSTGVKKGNFFDFFFSQFALFSPIPFILLAFARPKKIEKVLFFPYLLCFLFVLIVAFWKKMQPNWAFFLMPPLYLLAIRGGDFFKKSAIIFCSSIIFSTLTLFFALGIHLFQDKGFTSLSFRCNSFRQNAGNQKLKELILDAGYTSNMFLCSDKYQNVALLSFYGPEKKRAHLLPVTKTRKNQFSYWPGIKKESSGFFLVLENQSQEQLGWYENHYKSLLAPYFSNVTLKTVEPIFSIKEKGVRYALLFYCENYLGGNFLEQNLY